MKKGFKRVIAAISAVTVIAFGGISASATTADDVIAAARGAGILDTYVAQLENFLRANEFTSNQYDMMIDGLGNIRNISMDVVRQYFPDAQSIDEFFVGGGSSDDSDSDNTSPTTKPENLSKDEQSLKDMAEQIQDNMTNEQMLDAIQEVIDTGKKIGLDVTVEQTGDKSFTMTVKDKDGNVKLVAPIGKLVSTTGVEAQQQDGSFVTVAAICASVLVAGGIGAWVLSRKNSRIGE